MRGSAASACVSESAAQARAGRYLYRGHPRGRRLNDHVLSGKLAGLRSAVVGITAENRAVVMVYRATARSVIIYMVDEHDAAYRSLIERA